MNRLSDVSLTCVGNEHYIAQHTLEPNLLSDTRVGAVAMPCGIVGVECLDA